MSNAKWIGGVVVKRMMDVLMAVTLLILLAPLLILVALLIKYQMGSPILFKQQRSGLNGSLFLLYKFRTMSNETDVNGYLLSDGERLTRFGLLLRKYSIDELPQLVNVIKGDMSLVGPRPLLVEYLSLYTEEQYQRHQTRPGITGWAQVNGRNAISWEKKFKLDNWYVDNQTIWLDIKILYITVIKVFKKEGINQQSHVSTKKFTGTDETV